MKNNMYKYENRYTNQGFKCIAGIDEVGRGSWAGPVVAACCVLPQKYRNDLIMDSKKLSAKKRTELAEIIKTNALDYSIIFVDAEFIDNNNIKQASIHAMQKALLAIRKVNVDMVLVDAERIETKKKSKPIIKGDDKSISIAAASILAKVARDEYMINLSNIYPNYGFDKHKGYGTKTHLSNLRKYGPIKKTHRMSFKPMSQLWATTK